MKDKDDDEYVSMQYVPIRKAFPQDIEKEEKFFENILTRAGVKIDTASAIASLIGYILGGKIPEKTKKRWEELKIIDTKRNGVYIDTRIFNKEDIDAGPRFLQLLADLWEGNIEFEGKEKI